jgi:hypothetical protein
MMTMPAPTYTPDIDPGIAAFDANGALTLIRWTSFNVGLQYYFPGLDGRLWISGNYGRTMSSNSSTRLGLAEARPRRRPPRRRPRCARTRTGPT